MGSLLAAPVTTKVIEKYNEDNFIASSVAVNGYRLSMEDTSQMVFRKGWAYGGVFDGHAGGDCSIFIADAILKQLDKLDVDIASGELTNKILKEICYRVDKEYMNTGGNSGTTATFFIAHSYMNDNCQLIIANIGDSRTMLFNNDTVLLATVDHKPNDSEEYGRITKARGFVSHNRVNGQLAVSRAFGDRSYKDLDAISQADYFDSAVTVKPDILRTSFTKDNVLVCCCDGMFESDCWSTHSIGNYVMDKIKLEDPKYLVATLSQMAIDRGSKDNVSILLFRYKYPHEGGLLYQKETVVGPCLVPYAPNYMNAYTKMAELGGLTLIEALCQRIQVVSAKYEQTDEKGGMTDELILLHNIVNMTQSITK
tara:strand:- start:734 stop:1837 length:1104 start_codon:yes stop_codon:yes gene_type:complete